MGAVRIRGTASETKHNDAENTGLLCLLPVCQNKKKLMVNNNNNNCVFFHVCCFMGFGMSQLAEADTK